MYKSNEIADQSSENSVCPYCAALKEVNDPSEGDCQYCAAMDTAGSDDVDSSCQYCAAMQHQESECEYCGRGPEINNPTTTDSQDYAGQGLNTPELAKPILGEDPQGQATSMDDTTNNNLALDGRGQGESNVQVSAGPNMDAGPGESVQVDQSKEAMQQIAQQIEGTAGVGNGPGPQGEATARNIDEASLIPNTDVVDGVSRPGGYDQNSPSDLGLGEDNGSSTPDLTSVLHEGLDAHADNINRERVVQMVSEALSGFKSCKQIIERAQEQAPQLYQSSIMMLKAMIEMAKLLGLSEDSSSADANPLEGNPESEWQDPFALHPDQGGSPVPGHAPSEGSASQDGDQNTGNEWANPFPTHPDNGGEASQGIIGQPVGKLPTSATTHHVARETLAPGAVNAKGQKKYVDPADGSEHFINMREGRVLSSTGKPVKPQQG